MLGDLRIENFSLYILEGLKIPTSYTPISRD